MSASILSAVVLLLLLTGTSIFLIVAQCCCCKKKRKAETEEQRRKREEFEAWRRKDEQNEYPASMPTCLKRPMPMKGKSKNTPRTPKTGKSRERRRATDNGGQLMVSPSVPNMPSDLLTRPHQAPQGRGDQRQRAPAKPERPPEAWKSGMAAPGDYATIADLDKDIFAGGGAAGRPSPTVVAPTPSGFSEDFGPEGQPRSGIAKPGDYMTWDNLDKNVFERPHSPTVAAPTPSGFSEDFTAEKKARSGIAKPGDYMTWDNLDKDVFAKQ